MKRESVKVQEILDIKPGKSKCFAMEHPSQCFSARSLVGYVNSCRKPVSVARYTTKVDYNEKVITITAIPVGEDE